LVKRKNFLLSFSYMPIVKVTQEYILKQALQVFRQKSYYNATMADIAEACGLLKGSIYHYFPSKEALMKEVLKTAHHYFQVKVFNIAYQKNLPARERMQMMLKNIEAIFIDNETNCIMGNIGVETSRLIPEFSELIQEFFNNWIDAFTEVYKEKYAEAKAREVAEFSVAEIEGSVMLSRIFNNPKFLRDAHVRVMGRLN
jgi:TetR/AcrR family transcriptional repressor of nem operon